MLQDYFNLDIAPYTTPVTFLAGDIIKEEGSEFKYLTYLESGTIKCCETQQNGIVNLISYISGPSFIGDLELVGARKGASGVTAVTNCKCVIIDLGRCKDKILNDVKFLQYLCYNFACKTVRNGNNITLGNSYPLKNRLATFIMNMQNNGLYTIPHTEASSYLGVSYRHLLYVLAQFQDEGILTKTKSGYVISDEKKLAELYIHQPE